MEEVGCDRPYSRVRRFRPICNMPKNDCDDSYRVQDKWVESDLNGYPRLYTRHTTLLILLYTFQRLGVAATVLLTAIFDLGAALLLGSIDIKSGIELIIITVFVYAGIHLAPMIAELILKIL